MGERREVGISKKNQITGKIEETKKITEKNKLRKKLKKMIRKPKKIDPFFYECTKIVNNIRGKILAQLSLSRGGKDREEPRPN
jgi:hypothetical protein